MFMVWKKIVECRSGEDLILYDRHRLLVEHVMRHVKLPCLCCLDGYRNDLGLQMCYFF